jgi:hypothetical protein
MNSKVLHYGQKFPFTNKSIFSQLAETFSTTLKELSKEYKQSYVRVELEKEALLIINDINLCIAETQTYRDMIEMYFINDMEIEEDNFTDLCLFFDDIADKVEILQKKDVSYFPKKYAELIKHRFDVFYEDIIMAKFEASQKIAEYIIDSEKN